MNGMQPLLIEMLEGDVLIVFQKVQLLDAIAKDHDGHCLANKYVSRKSKLKFICKEKHKTLCE